MSIKVSTDLTKIGWIGTGIMGEPMCGHLINAGYKTSVYNRTKEKAGRLVDCGATWCGTPSEVADNSDVVFTILGYPKDVREVYFGKE